MAEHDRDDPGGERAKLIFQAMTAAADNAGMGVAVSTVDPGNSHRIKVLYVNEGTTRLTGYTREEIERHSVLSVVAPEARAHAVDIHDRRMRGEDAPTVFETVVLHRDGRRIPIEFSTTRIELDGRPANVSFFFDITHRKNAEEALRRSETRFRSLVENAPDGVCILRWPTILFVNPRAARLLGFRNTEEPVGKNILSLLRPNEVSIAQDRAAHVQRGERHELAAEYASRDPDGREIVVEVTSIAIEYEGEPAMLGFARDVTERKAMLSQLMEADKLAAVGTLAAGVAHEINNPLAYLLLNLEFLIREMPKLVHDASRLPTMQSRLDEAKQGAERVKTIVRDLQTFTRRDQGIRGPVDLEAVVEAALHMARHEIRRRATILKSFEPIPPVHGNATRLEQLFLNLLINAAHAVSELQPDRNCIEISVRHGSGDSAVATVRDNGAGMEPDVLRHAFEPFFTTKPTGVGTGLGLPICMGIVRALGGDIQITSTPGTGTTATVTLPLHHGEYVPERPRTPPPSGSPDRRCRVLVIDDERAVAESLAIALRDEHEVIAVSSAAEARALFEAGEAFDIVLCDLVMPNETGMHLFEQVRAIRPQLAARFAFMTGGAFLPETERFLLQVNNPRIEKPFDVAALRRLVQRMLEDKPA